jgi:hypothetical protein
MNSQADALLAELEDADERTLTLIDELETPAPASQAYKY